MNQKVASPSKLWRLTLVLALFVSLVPALYPASAANPCDPYPTVCRYTYDPVERCCVADPRFDCFDVCFASVTGPAGSWQADLAKPEQLSGPVCGLASDPTAPQTDAFDFGKR
jgi:hypothetical protein